MHKASFHVIGQRVTTQPRASRSTKSLASAAWVQAVAVGFWLVRRAVAVARGFRGGRISATLALLLIVAATYVLPIRLWRDSASRTWQVPHGGPALAGGSDIPVFCMRSRKQATRCGIATVRDDARIGFALYGADYSADRAIPVLASADVGLLWALADPQERAKVQASASGLAGQLIASVEDVTESETWQSEYRFSLRHLLDHIAREAWRAPDTQEAFRALVRAAEPVVRESVATEMGPALAPYMAEAVWRIVKANTVGAWSVILSRELDLRAVAPVLTAALRDPAVQSQLGRLGPRILGLPETEVLMERLAANMGKAAQREPGTINLLTQMATDPRLGTRLRHFRSDTGAFMREIGQVLWGIGDKRSLNSLAGLSLKATIAAGSQPLILLLAPDEAAALAFALPGSATLLVPGSRT